jgi:Mrp family chromosome partitioning ATPase
MRDLLERVPSEVDRVIIDTSPSLLVADAFPLFQAASGTLLVARLNRTYKEAARRLAWIIRNAGGNLLGTVVTGAESRDLYGDYDYAYGRGGEPVARNGLPLSNGTGPGRLAKLFRRNGAAMGRESQSPRVGSRNQ